MLLAGEFAYKVKKPVDLGFLDFRELDRRRFFCEEELRLNRYWAPELYLDVVPIGMRDGCARVGRFDPAVECAVCMRRFDQALRLDHQLEAGMLTANVMLELAAEIAARHQAADRAGPPGRLLLATKRLMWENFDDLIGEVSQEQIVALHRWTQESLGRHEAKLKERCRKGFYRECHGDLHLGNIVRLAGGIKAFDCIEFSEVLRQIDVVVDHGFLVMDLLARGRTDLVMNGLAGSGKTWLSTRLVTAMPAVRIRSDLERKRLFGLEEAADSDSGIASGIYDRKAGRAVYDRLFDGARSMLGAGFDVILDAAFLGAEVRGRAKRIAADCAADFVIVQATAPQRTLEERLRQRRAAGKDASEADLAVLRHQLETSELLTANEARRAVTVNTGSEVDLSSIVLEVRRRTGSF